MNDTSFQTQWLHIKTNTIASLVLVKLINITMSRAPGTTWSWLQVQYLLDLTEILLSLFAQTNTNTNGANLIFAKDFTKYLFRLLINLYIQTKHHPVAVNQSGAERKNPKLKHFYKQGCAYIHYFHTCDKILNFINGLWVFLVNTFHCSFWWQSCGYESHLSFHNLERSYSSSIIFDHIFDLSADHCWSCSTRL